MSKDTREELEERKHLQSEGWDVQKEDAVKFNHGSETVKHSVCKLLAAWCLREYGFRVDTEVEMGNGEVDVLAYSAEDTFAVECETNPTTEVVMDKVTRYVRNEPIRECFVLPVNEMPVDMLDAKGWVEQELFGSDV